MTAPFGVCADLHMHNWSAFASVDAEGVNSRLAIQLAELGRMAAEVKTAGGSQIFIAGDLFHVRGSIDPSVFNAVYEMLRHISEHLGVWVTIMPGNHDLKGRETTMLGNAAHALGGLTHVFVANNLYVDVEHRVVVVPWEPTVADLWRVLKDAPRSIPERVEKYDLIIHAPLNYVIPGIPDKGINPKDLLDLGFKRVFVGHYHDHKEFKGLDDRSVYSIGATTHQTWSDVGTKAGFLLVYPDRVDWRASHAPKFIDVTPATDVDDIPLLVDGNYVRVSFDGLTEKEAKRWRDELLGMGAKGVVIATAATPVITRTGTAPTAASMSMEVCVGAFITDLKHPQETALNGLCMDILSEARRVE